MNDNKVYVEVIVKFSTEGAMMPIEFIWEDGTKYLIDKVNRKNVVPAGKRVVQELCIL